jgi:hypothetical protein
MNKKYGCDVVEYDELVSEGMFSKEFIDDLKKFGCVEVLRLNQRKKGMTSSGAKLRCHWNVMSLVSAYGGNHKHGYLLEQNWEDDWAQLTYHSAWLTPEKQLVCVTPRDRNGKRFKSKDTFFFMFPDNGELNIKYDSVVWTHRNFFEYDSVSEDSITPPILMPHYRNARIKHKIKVLDDSIFEKEVKQKLNGLFSKKSILTNKSFDEIYETPYARKMRDLFVLPKNKKHSKKLRKQREELSFHLSAA